jgi:hypothetical protein
MICPDLLVFARKPDHSKNITVHAEIIIRTEEENIVSTVLTIIIFLKVQVKYNQVCLLLNG